MEFDFVMSIDATAGNDSMKQRKVVTMTCYKCGQEDHYRTDCHDAIDSNPVPDQNQIYNLPTFVTQMDTASYSVPQSNLVHILKELAKA